MTGSPGFLRSTIGRKVVMAVTGVLLVAFLVEHMLGNLLVFGGPAVLNTYAEILKRYPAVLWSFRIGLLLAAALHIWAALSLTRLSRASRPVAYARREPQVFIVFHLLHMTVGAIHPGFAFSRTDVYANVTSAFQVPWVALFYVVAMVALLAHLNHGVWSFFQTMGWNHPRFEKARRIFATVVALIVSLGLMLIPAAVLGGMLR